MMIDDAHELLILFYFILFTHCIIIIISSTWVKWLKIMHKKNQEKYSIMRANCPIRNWNGFLSLQSFHLIIIIINYLFIIIYYILYYILLYAYYFSFFNNKYIWAKYSCFAVFLESTDKCTSWRARAKTFITVVDINVKMYD